MQAVSSQDQNNIDFTVIEFNLSLSFEERIENHEAARNLMLDLRDAGKRFYETQSEAPSRETPSV